MRFPPGRGSRVHAIRRWASNGYDFHITREGPGGSTVAVGLPVVFEEVDGESPIRDDLGPTFSLANDECQGLMDELWRAGFRPSEGTGSAGALRQAEGHIESLRAIAFTLSGVVEGKK